MPGGYMATGIGLKAPGIRTGARLPGDCSCLCGNKAITPLVHPQFNSYGACFPHNTFVTNVNDCPKIESLYQPQFQESGSP